VTDDATSTPTGSRGGAPAIPASPASPFRWVALAVAAAFGATLLWMLNDLRIEAKRASTTVNEHLPQVLANVQQSTAAMAQLAKDLENLRDLAGVANVSRDRSLVGYADEILDLLEKQPGAIGLDKVLGSGMKSTVPVAEWVRAARKEAIWLTFRANSKRELLERLGKTKFGADWYYAPPTGAPVRLIDFIAHQLPPAASDTSTP